MPDKFPLTPGHVLIISKEHLACYGAGGPEVWSDLEASAEQVLRFLKAAYGRPVFVWENGVSGQSVFHAHLHFIPLPVDEIRLDLAEEPRARPVAGWETVREHFQEHGTYRYLALDGQRFLLPGHSPILRQITGLLAGAADLEYAPGGWVKKTTPADVAEVSRRWAVWPGSAQDWERTSS